MCERTLVPYQYNCQIILTILGIVRPVTFYWVTEKRDNQRAFLQFLSSNMDHFPLSWGRPVSYQYLRVVQVPKERYSVTTMWTSITPTQSNLDLIGGTRKPSRMLFSILSTRVLFAFRH